MIRKSDSSPSSEEISFLDRELMNVRDEFADNPYILEATKVLAVGGYRSAIGSYWNAVVDDLRRKVIHRSLDLFNKEMRLKKTIKDYGDFEDCVLDHDLIEGAYKIGVLGKEDRKMLQHARDIRNTFSGHPTSTEPNYYHLFPIVISTSSRSHIALRLSTLRITLKRWIVEILTEIPLRSNIHLVIYL